MTASLLVLGVWLLGAVAPGAPAPRARPSPSPTAVSRPVPKAKAARRTPRPRVDPTSTPTPTPRPPDPEYDTLVRMPVDEIERLQLLGPVYFEEASAAIRDVDQPVLENNAAVLKRFDFLLITLEAHCDGRGDVDYNLRLGDQRAKAVLKRLVALGVPASRLRTVSFGKEVPLCGGDEEDCLTRSRRVQFAIAGKRKD